jgi:hypothetical protein
MEDGPVAGVTIALDGHGQLFALATRRAIDALVSRRASAYSR